MYVCVCIYVCTVTIVTVNTVSCLVIGRVFEDTRNNKIR